MTLKKTQISILLILTTLMFTLCGCGDDEANEILVGKWHPTSAVLNGESVKYSELGLEEGYFEFEFSSNGNCTATLAGIDYKGTYTFEETSVDAVLSGVHEKLIYERVQGTITYNFDNTTSFTFIKDKTE